VSRSLKLSSLLAVVCALGPGCRTDPAVDGAQVSFDLQTASATEGHFFDFPFPSDLRLRADGTPDLALYPSNNVKVVQGFLKGAQERKGFPVVPVGYFRFDRALSPSEVDTVVPADKTQPLLLIDVDERSPERGKLFPVVAATPNEDTYMPPNVLEMAARPGVVLHAKRTYAFVVMRAYKDAQGQPLRAPESFSRLLQGDGAGQSRGDELVKLYAPLASALRVADVPVGGVAAATVFTTGDVVQDNADLTERVRAAYKLDITGATQEPDPNNLFPSFCHVTATVRFPQFQKGAPPFSSEGLFAFGPDGLPQKTRDEDAVVSISIPKQPMPEGGYPLVIYFHGSGGVAREHVDGGDKGIQDPVSRWPSAALAPKGIAMAGSALPISPDRVPGAGAFDYLPLANPIAMRDIFRQGIIEQRLFIDALERLRIPKEALAGCSGATLPASEPSFRLSMKPLSVQGQSMGGMYTNLVTAIEPRIGAAVPTGAGGYWMYFILRTKRVGGEPFLRLLLGTDQALNFMHPALHAGQMAFEPIDPMVSMPRLSKEPLAGHAPRHILQPVGINDSFFPEPIYDAMTLAYGHPRAGDEVWPSMRAAQGLLGIDAPVAYPVSNNLKSEDGRGYTGAVIQFPAPDFDGHGVYRRVATLQHQFSCFHSAFRKTGVGSIPPPAAFEAACP